MILMLTSGCDLQPPSDLDQAAKVIQYMMKPNHLARSAFAAAFSDPKPSQFVSYLFSEMGAAEWPAADTLADELEREQMKAIGAPMLPAGVAFVPRMVDPERGRQLVVMFDDSRGVVIVVGYENPAQTPVFKREWILPHVDPVPGVRAMYQAGLQAGMSYQSF
jgi:hypothetical protein